jgi:hypothetical protein
MRRPESDRRVSEFYPQVSQIPQMTRSVTLSEVEGSLRLQPQITQTTQIHGSDEAETRMRSEDTSIHRLHRFRVRTPRVGEDQPQITQITQIS